MPDKILSKDQLAQLDGNIRKMVGDGLGREDIDAYARDFKERFGKSDGSSVDSVPATSAITIVQPGAPVSKYQKAVNDDRSEIGKFASKWYNNIVSSFERIGGAVADLPAQFNIAAPGFAPTEIGKAQEQAKAFTQQPLAKRLEPAKELKQKIGKAADVVRSGYTTREEERATAGQFNIMDGIGLSDIEALASMSGGMAVDMGLGAMTGSGTFLLQGYNDAVEDYDAATQKAGLEPSEGARGLYGIAGGVINGLLEKFAVDKLVGDTPVFKDIQKKAIANVLKNTAGMTGKKAVDAIETAAVAEIKKLTSDIKSRGVRAAYRTAVEGGTEAVQAALEDGAKLAANLVQGNEAFNEDEIRKGFIQNIVNSGVAGGIMGPIFGAGADKAFGRNVNTQVLKDISEANTPEQLAAINDELAATFDENNFTQEERDAVMANANRYAQIKQTLPAGTNSIAQTIAIPLIENRIKIDNEIQTRRNAMESVDEALKADEESAIALLEDKRAQINDDIREVVNNEKFDYYEDNGKFYKKLGENAPEEISKNRFDLQQLKTEGYATTTGQGPIQEGGTTGDIGQRQGTQEGGTQETPPQTDTSYRYIVSEEGSEFPVRALVNKKVRKDGRPAILYQEGQRIVARILGTNRIEDVGNVVEMMDALPQDFGIEVDETVVTETPTGYRVEGEDMVNDSENPLDAISMDQNGNVMNVVLKTPAGKRRKFRGQAAKDLAYQITLKETLKNEDEFELFLEQEHQAELDAAEAKAAAEAATNAANEPVPTTEEPTTTEPVTGPTTEPTTGPTVTTKPTYGTVTVDNIDRIDKLKGYDRLQRKVLKDVKNVVLAIRFILQSQGKEVAVNLHSQESFENAVIEAGGSKEDSTSRGFYMTDDGSIHLNMENLASDTMLHEGFHPILDFLEANDPKVINDFFSQLEAIPGSEDIIAQARENYDGDVTQKKEAITDFVAGVADGRIVLNPSNFRKIRKFLLDMLNKIGIGKGGGTIMEVKDPKGLIELAKLVTEDFTEGFAIYKYELLDIISGDKKYDSSDGVDIDETLPEEGTDRGPQFSKSTIEAARKNIKSIASLIGTKISRVVFYDLTRVGPLDIKNIKSGYTPKVEGKGGPFYSYMEQRSNDKAVLAFVSLTQAIQSLNRQILYPNGVHAITSQNPQTGHLGNKSTLAALFGEGIGIFQNAATTQEEETEIVNTLVGEIDRLSKVKVEPGKKEPEVVANVKKILKVVDLASIKTIDDFRDKILLGEGDSFGSRGSILDEILQEKQTKVTKSTRGSHTILHYKYGIPTKADIAEGNNQKELSSAELGDVIKLVRPSTDRVIYTTSKAEFDLYSKNPSDGMVEAGIRIELLPESSVHESYPFILAGENVALLENYISVAQLYEEFKDVKKSLSFFKLGRMKKDAAAGEIPKTVTKEEGAPKFQSQKAVNKDIQQRTNAASEKLKQLFNRGNIPLNISEAKQIVNEVIDWSSWYDGISDYVNDIFGEYSEDVLSLLPLASQGNGSAGTVALAINNIERIYKGEKPVGLAEYKGYVSDFLGGKGIESDKMYNFFKALTGDKDAIAVDMHVWSIIMGKNPNKKQVNPKNQAQFNRAKEFVNLLSKELGLAPREVQASLWAANILRTGGKPDSYEEYIARQVEKNGLKERIEGWRDKGYKPFSEVRKAREAVRAEGKEPQFQRVAPNGKPSNLNPSQYEQVRTPAFKKWFGDWENDPANASKVVDDNGEPLVVYHGTNVKENFDTFKGTDYIFFAKDADFASEYARAMNGRVVPAFVNAKKIFDPTEMTQSEEDDIFDIIEKEELNRGANEDRAYDIAYQTIKRLTNKVEDNWLIAESDQVNKYIKSKGYDALAVRETGSENIAVIDPNQIKSATGNVGTFSTEDNRIQFQKGPIKWEKSKEGKGDPSISSRNPIVVEAAKNLKEGKITNDEYRATVSANSPITPITRFFEPATEKEISKALSSDKIEKVNIPVDDNTVVGLRLDIPAYSNNNTWVVSVHEGSTNAGKAVSYTNVARITDVKFGVEPKGALSIATGVPKTTIGRMFGKWQNIDGATMEQQGDNAKALVQDIVNDPNYVQVGMNPFRHSYFYDRSTDMGRPIVSADEVVQIGGLVYAKNPVYGNWTDESYRVKGLFDAAGAPVQFQKAPTKPITKGKLGGVKKTFKEQARYGLLGKESVRLKEKMSGELSAELATAETRVKETMKTIKKYGGAVTEKDISDFMEGKPSVNQLPLDLATQLTEMRAQIDGLTERLIQLGVIDSQESIDYYRENKGKYLLRSYEAINFKENPLMANFQGKGLNIDNVAKKLKNVDQTVVDTALQYLSDRAKAANPALTDAEAMKIARADANEILSDSEDYVMNKGMTGSTNVKSLRQRKDISPEIRALMGEYTDPLYNYYATIFKISSLTSSRQYLNSLKEFGMGKFFFTEKTEDATVKFAGDESDALAPLNGIWTFPEIKESLKVAEKETTTLISQMAGRVRMLKTVYNPATHVKNIIGNMGFAVSNGHWQNIPEAYKYMRAAITGKTDQDIMNMMDTLNRYGVLNNVIGVGELKAYFDKNESVDDFLKSVYNNANSSTTASKLGKAKANLAKIPKAIEKAYAIEDDVFKILAFVNESNRYSKALFDKNYNKLSDDQKKEIDAIASEIVKDTYPTFSRVPKGVRTLSKFAFLGNFLAFPVESVRTQYNSLNLAVKEMRSGNEKLKSVGRLRLSGAIIYNSLFASMSIFAYNLAGAGLTGAVGMLFGDDDEKKDETSRAINKNLAPWNKSSDVYVSKFKDGMLEYYDIGSLDSYGYQRRVWNAFWSTKNKGEFDQMMASGIGEALDPWMTKDFVIDNYMKLSSNDNGRGGTIYNPEGKPMDKFKDMSLYVGKQFGPGAVGSAIKVAEAYQKGEYEKVMDELGAQVFARRYSVDLNKQFQNYIYTEGTDPKKEVGFKYRLQNAEKIYRDAKRQKLSPAKLSEKYGEALEAYKEILLTANEYYKAAALGGTNPKLLIESLKKSRIGRAEAMAIITGSFGKYDQAYIRK